MSIFVLVPGSQGGGWYWNRIVPILRRSGCEVFTPTLTGLGERSHLVSNDITLSIHTRDVLQVLYYEDLSNVVLVGHSYGGMVITSVANTDPSRLRQLIYLDAYVPEPGESELDLWPPEWAETARSDMAAGKPYRRPISATALGITDSTLAAWVDARFTEHPLSTYVDSPPRGSEASERLPKAFVHLTPWPGGPGAALMKRFADRAREKGWPVIEFPKGHMAMLTEPDRLAEILINTARGND